MRPPVPAPTTQPAAGAPAVTAQSPAPAAAPVATGTPSDVRPRGLAAGVQLTGPTNAPICNIANRPGDRFVVALGQTVTGADGVALPAGTPVLVELAQAPAEGDFAFRLRGVQIEGQFVPADGTVRISEGPITERRVSKGGSDQGKVIAGAVIGGLLGRVIGGGTRGAVIGAAGGAAAGTVAAARNTTTERCLAAGAILSTPLTAPLVFP